MRWGLRKPGRGRGTRWHVDRLAIYESASSLEVRWTLQLLVMLAALSAPSLPVRYSTPRILVLVCRRSLHPLLPQILTRDECANRCKLNRGRDEQIRKTPARGNVKRRGGSRVAWHSYMDKTFSTAPMSQLARSFWLESFLGLYNKFSERGKDGEEPRSLCLLFI